MNEFEHRWRMGVKSAQSAQPVQGDEAPFGFAARVVARWPLNEETSLTLLWQGLALRVLGVMALILLSLAAYGAVSSTGDAPLQPPVENAVADSFWLL